MPWRNWLGALRPFPLDIALAAVAALAAGWTATYFGFDPVYLVAALIVGTALLMGTGWRCPRRRSAPHRNS